jgi:enoyl-CoA hydratase/carnithine racemase
METIRLSQPGTGIAEITLDRPAAMNAVSSAMAEELTRACEQLAIATEVRVVVFSAAGERAFSAGADLKERAGLSDADIMAQRHVIRGLFGALLALPQPAIAAVHGFALGGGCELALSCDLVVADETAVFGLPEVTVGLVPGGGGTQLALRRLGPGRAAKRALRHGWGVSLEAGLDVEDAAWRTAAASPDRREGIAAFAEKRKPVWPGR